MTCCTHNCRQGRDCPNRPRRDLPDFGRIARAARTWTKRLWVSTLMHSGFLSPSMQLLWLEWLRDDLKPTDPRLPAVLLEIAHVKELCRA